MPVTFTAGGKRWHISAKRLGSRSTGRPPSRRARAWGRLRPGAGPPPPERALLRGRGHAASTRLRPRADVLPHQDRERAQRRAAERRHRAPRPQAGDRRGAAGRRPQARRRGRRRRPGTGRVRARRARRAAGADPCRPGDRREPAPGTVSGEVGGLRAGAPAARRARVASAALAHRPTSAAAERRRHAPAHRRAGRRALLRAAGRSASPTRRSTPASPCTRAAASTITPERPGRELDLRKASAAVLAAALSRSDRADALSVVAAQPERTTADAQAWASAASCRSYETIYGGDANRIHNVQLVAQLIDGALIAPGKEFSFNATTGERTADKGFLEAPVIVNGELQTGLGGGICQVSTTVFNAAFEAGLPITARTNHALYISHYPQGRDATVNYPDLDLKFVNDTGHWLLLRTFVGPSSLVVNLYGTPTPGASSRRPAPLNVVGAVPVKRVSTRRSRRASRSSRSTASRRARRASRGSSTPRTARSGRAPRGTRPTAARRGRPRRDEGAGEDAAAEGRDDDRPAPTRPPRPRRPTLRRRRRVALSAARIASTRYAGSRVGRYVSASTHA